MNNQGVPPALFSEHVIPESKNNETDSEIGVIGKPQTPNYASWLYCVIIYVDNNTSKNDTNCY